MVVFYNLYGVLFFVVTRVQPPPSPAWDTPTVVQWFNDHDLGILAGFGIVFLIAGMCAPMNALLAYSMRRMSVSPVFAYSYLIIYALSAVPGMLVMAIAMTVGALRPDRDPELIQWLYDFAFLSFSGTMGVFLIGSLVWMVAILLDKNRVFPKWFGYLNLCNALTEVVVAPAWIFQRGVFAWNGAIAWWINMVVFVIYTGVFITLLRRMIQREDFGTGPLPVAPDRSRAGSQDTVGAASMTNVAGTGSRTEELDVAPTRFVPGQPDMWVFVLFETLLFTGYFSVYLVSRTQNHDLFLQSQADLDLRIGVFNTIVLLLSSWAIARCVQAARGGCVPVGTDQRLRDGLLRAGLPGLQGGRVGQGDPDGKHVHQQRVLPALLLPDIDPLHPRADRLRRARRRRLPAVEPGPAVPAAGRDGRHVLAHRRFPVGSHLRSALRREVIREHHIQQATDDRLGDPDRR